METSTSNFSLKLREHLFRKLKAYTRLIIYEVSLETYPIL